MDVFGKISRSSRASVVLPLDEQPDIPTIRALLFPDILEKDPRRCKGEKGRELRGAIDSTYRWVRLAAVLNPCDNKRHKVQLRSSHFKSDQNNNHEHADNATMTQPYNEGQVTGLIIGTAVATFLGGFLMGVWTINGSIFPSEMWEERKKNLRAPEETDESDVDEDEPMDHAPAWSNGRQADEKQGLRASALPSVNVGGPNEECKLVLVVRTDLGMTKGISSSFNFLL